MNKKIYLVLILVIIFLVIGVSFLALNIFKKPELLNVNKTLTNQPAEPEKPKEIAIMALNSLLEFYSFCDYNNGNSKSILTSCESILGPKKSSCVQDVSLLSLFYYVKNNNQQKFLTVCEDYRASRPKITSCVSLWDIMSNKDLEFCDETEKSCQFAVDANNPLVCQNKFTTDTAQTDSLTPMCKKIISLRKNSTYDDCSKIEDDLTRYLCWQPFVNVCGELVKALDVNKMVFNQPGFQSFIDNYKLNNCCYTTDAEKDAKILQDNGFSEAYTKSE